MLDTVPRADHRSYNFLAMLAAYPERDEKKPQPVVDWRPVEYRIL